MSSLSDAKTSMATGQKVGTRPSRRRPSVDPKIMKEVTEALKEIWDIDAPSARRFIRRHKGLASQELISFVQELEFLLRRMHIAHFGYEPAEEVIRRAVEYSIDRLTMTRGGLSEKQLAYYVQYARDEIASEQIRRSDPGTPEKRKAVMRPLEEVIECEEDEFVHDRLVFIYNLFVKNGLRIAKKEIVDACLRNKDLFARRRAVEDTIETLRSAYEALGFENGEMFIAPEYLEVEPVMGH